MRYIERCGQCNALVPEDYYHLCPNSTIGKELPSAEETLAQERYKLVKLYAGQFAAIHWKPNGKTLLECVTFAETLADAVLKLHPLYPTKEKEVE